MALALASAPRPVGGLYLLRQAKSVHPAVRNWTPKSPLGFAVLKALPYLPEDLRLELVDRISSSGVMSSSLRLKAIRRLRDYKQGRILRRDLVIEDYGVVGTRQVVDNGCGFIVDAFADSVELENMKYHGLGTGTTAEASNQTALITELTTEYTGNVRATGTTTEASQKVYETVATNTLDGTPGAALREHGIFSANASGVLLDRTLFDAITLSSGDGLQSTYDLTFSSGG